MSHRILRISCDPDSRIPVAFDLYADGEVAVLRWYAGVAMWGEIGRGKFVDGEILGMPGGEYVPEKVYEKVESAIERWLSVA